MGPIPVQKSDRCRVHSQTTLATHQRVPLDSRLNRGDAVPVSPVRTYVGCRYTFLNEKHNERSVRAESAESVSRVRLVCVQSQLRVRAESAESVSRVRIVCVQSQLRVRAGSAESVSRVR
jgi:hypothetical protein